MASVNERSARQFNEIVRPVGKAERAENERGDMASPFCAWVCEQRREAELSAFGLRRFLRECEPFALAAVGEAEQIEVSEPASTSHAVTVPAVVWEYASTALQLTMAEARLALLNAYYFDAAAPLSDVTLNVTPQNEAAVRVLWTEYMAAQDLED